MAKKNEVKLNVTNTDLFTLCSALSSRVLEEASTRGHYDETLESGSFTLKIDTT